MRYCRDTASGIYTDFCANCYLHETEHTNTQRCLTGATQFKAPR
jgi:hypothetical protein